MLSYILQSQNKSSHANGLPPALCSTHTIPATCLTVAGGAVAGAVSPSASAALHAVLGREVMTGGCMEDIGVFLVLHADKEEGDYVNVTFPTTTSSFSVTRSRLTGSRLPAGSGAVAKLQPEPTASQPAKEINRLTAKKLYPETAVNCAVESLNTPETLKDVKSDSFRRLVKRMPQRSAVIANLGYIISAVCYDEKKFDKACKAIGDRALVNPVEMTHLTGAVRDASEGWKERRYVVVHPLLTRAEALAQCAVIWCQPPLTTLKCLLEHAKKLESMEEHTKKALCDLAKAVRSLIESSRILIDAKVAKQHFCLYGPIDRKRMLEQVQGHLHVKIAKNGDYKTLDSSLKAVNSLVTAERLFNEVSVKKREVAEELSARSSDWLAAPREAYPVDLVSQIKYFYDGLIKLMESDGEGAEQFVNDTLEKVKGLDVKINTPATSWSASTSTPKIPPKIWALTRTGPDRRNTRVLPNTQPETRIFEMPQNVLDLAQLHYRKNVRLRASTLKSGALESDAQHRQRPASLGPRTLEIRADRNDRYHQNPTSVTRRFQTLNVRPGLIPPGQSFLEHGVW